MRLWIALALGLLASPSLAQPRMPILGAGGTPGAASNPIGLDANANAVVTANASSGSTLALPAMTTNSTNVVLIVMALTNTNIISTITDTAGLTWARRAHTDTGAGEYVDEWWAVSASALSANVITLNFAGAVAFVTASGYAVTNGKTSAPFDINVSLPATSITATVAVSTTATNTMGIGAYRATATASPTGTGWTSILGANFFLSEYKLFASAQTATTVPMDQATNGGIGDALVQGP